MGPAMVLLGAFVAARPCPVVECLAYLRSLVRVEVGHAEHAAVLGHWTKGGGFTGEELYVFVDRSYLATEWGCLQPETIHDRGSWVITDGVLILTSDSSVTWPLRRYGNRRYAVLQFDGDVRLFGLDGSLALLPRILSADVALPEATEVARHLSLAHAEVYEPTAWRQAKAALLAEAWRPSYFEQDKTP